ncbi:hypothetical protein J8A71_03125 [Mycoplasmopsis agalactiae]|uniref:hypothetical protein n=1 Tax=Mycoplasmopsis agalactiae TaxID=2110 RepID=UPI001F337409|nr:hypothetical protein [Mycoplasmopsis agalactiae]MCE6061872.1 hypothetical protein [Mycoplasmopsis agalactiae]
MAKEKNLENKIKSKLKKHKLNYLKIHGGVYQVSGRPDLLIFNNFNTYAMELKSDFKISKPSMLQISQANAHKNNLIWLFVDINNYKEIVEAVINNNINYLIHIAQKQLEYWMDYFNNEKTI